MKHNFLKGLVALAAFGWISHASAVTVPFMQPFATTSNSITQFQVNVSPSDTFAIFDISDFGGDLDAADKVIMDTGGNGSDEILVDPDDQQSTTNTILTSVDDSSQSITLSDGRFFFAWSANGTTGWIPWIETLTNSGTSYTFDFSGTQSTLFVGDITPVGPPTEIPVPAALWLFGSGLLGLAGVARKKAA
jgi:hypothetical protein